MFFCVKGPGIFSLNATVRIFMELSTIFLCNHLLMAEWNLKKHKFYGLNAQLFLITFFVTRQAGCFTQYVSLTFMNWVKFKFQKYKDIANRATMVPFFYVEWHTDKGIDWQLESFLFRSALSASRRSELDLVP